MRRTTTATTTVLPTFRAMPLCLPPSLPPTPSPTASPPPLSSLSRAPRRPPPPAALQGSLRAEGPLWESSKFMSNGSGVPDLSPDLWYLLGCAHARCGRHRKAAEALRRAAGLMPGHPAFLHELAKACQVSAGGLPPLLSLLRRACVSLAVVGSEQRTPCARLHTHVRFWDERCARKWSGVGPIGGALREGRGGSGGKWGGTRGSSACGA